MFRHSHDPTQLNRQGNDVGTQYRSAIFPNSPEQEAAASAAIERNQTDWPQPIVTTVEPFDIWWRAEDYHQEYFDREGGRNPYCIAGAAPKLAKFRKSYADRLKTARSEEHTSELQSLMRIPYAVFCLKKNNTQ